MTLLAHKDYFCNNFKWLDSHAKVVGEKKGKSVIFEHIAFFTGLFHQIQVYMCYAWETRNLLSFTRRGFNAILEISHFRKNVTNFVNCRLKLNTLKIKSFPFYRLKQSILKKTNKNKRTKKKKKKKIIFCYLLVCRQTILLRHKIGNMPKFLFYKRQFGALFLINGSIDEGLDGGTKNR